MTSKSLKVWFDRSVKSFGRYFSSFRAGMIMEKKGWVICVLYNELMITKEQVYEKLKKVMDPELFIDIVSLGLIYGVKVEGKSEKVKIIVTMTLTTPGCPLAPVIDQLVRDAIKPLGEYEIVLDLVWEPAWTKDRMSDEAKLQLGVI